MKSFSKLIAAAMAIMLLFGIAANIIMIKSLDKQTGEYRVYLERAKLAIDENGYADADDFRFITGIYKYSGEQDFYESSSDYIIYQSGGELYRIEFTKTDENESGRRIIIIADIMIGICLILLLCVLIYIRRTIIKPFGTISEMPYELAKGNLTAPVKENRSRYFGRFLWGTDMLRERLEDQRRRELALAKDKQTLILSLSHDIKTPLSAIKLYSKALEKGLYTDEDKLCEVYSGISDKCGEIEGYLSKLSLAAKEDFLSLEVHPGEEYLSLIIKNISDYYTDKLAITGTSFSIEKYTDCLLCCDSERAVEVLQNLMENAIKYGDGKEISISFSDEEDCRLITVSNTGCTLNPDETVHIFESFYRGSNVGSKPGSGLGLYIARQLMIKMGGDIFADTSGGVMSITAVFKKA